MRNSEVIQTYVSILESYTAENMIFDKGFEYEALQSTSSDETNGLKKTLTAQGILRTLDMLSRHLK